MQTYKPNVKSDLFTRNELLGFLILFIFVLFVVFPRGRLEKYLLTSEKTNAELFYIYTKNLASITGNKRIWVEAVKNMSMIGNVEIARRFSEEAEQRGDLDLAYLSLYFADKTRYFSGQGIDLQTLNSHLTRTAESTQDVDILMEIVKEGTGMGLPYPVMLSAEKLYRITGEIRWLKEAYRHAVASKSFRHIILFGSELYLLEPQNRTKYVQDAAYVLRTQKEGSYILSELKGKLPPAFYDRVLFLASASAAKTGEPDGQKTPSQKALAGRVADLEAYLSIFKNSKDPEKRKDLFIKIVQMYSWRGEYDEMKTFISEHFTEFLEDEKVNLFVLKMSLASGDPAFAHQIALKVKESLLK